MVSRVVMVRMSIVRARGCARRFSGNGRSACGDTGRVWGAKRHTAQGEEDQD